MKRIILLLCTDVLKFFIVYSIFAYGVLELTEHLPRSWDATGLGMLAVILLFLGFLFGAFRVGASYSDEIEVQEPGSLLRFFKRPIRSAKYGIISVGLNLALVYSLIAISDYFLS